VHGDDFTSSGPKPSLDWFEQTLAEEYELSIGPRLGPGPGDAKEGRALNRVIRWCDKHIEYEADPRQAERLIAECGLGGPEVKPVATPGVKSTFTELEMDEELPSKLHTAFRGSAARGNYLAADRIDAQYACKEVCRWMSKPTAHAWTALKRVCRFLRGVPRLVYRYPQQTVDSVDVYTDTDWAGCPTTRKSTSGGCVMFGGHAIKHWSSTQASVALSSGAAEFAGVIRGAGQGLGSQALLKDLGVAAPLRVWTDSSAAIGICSRQGLGKLRHLDTHTLWIQQAVRTKRVDLRKVPGEENPADLLTKHSLSRERLEKLVALHGCVYLGGRAASAPKTRTGESSKSTMVSQGGGLIGATGNGVGAAQTARVGAMSGSVVNPAETSPVMPHLVLSGPRLDDAYPPLAVPEDDRLDDVDQDKDDSTFQAGLKIAEGINDDMQTFGRRKNEPNNDYDNTVNYLTNTTTTTTTTTTASTTTTTTCDTRSQQKKGKEPKPQLKKKRKEDKERGDVGKNHKQATSHSTLGRRRSVCGTKVGDPEKGFKDSEERSEMPSSCASHHQSSQLRQPRARVLRRIGSSRLASYVDTSGLHKF
jgi:hypothetical protein